VASSSCRGLNSNLGHFSCFTYIFVSCGESCLLVSWCAVGRCGMVGSDEDHGKSRRPGIENRGWSSTGRVLGGRMIEGSVMLFAVCTMHEQHGFLGLASKPR
jgi:hypothetical protein